MDTQDQTVIAILVAGLCSATVWIGLRRLPSRDSLVSRRLLALAGSGGADLEHRGVRALDVVRYLGMRFPERKDSSVESQLRAAGLEDVHLFRGVQLVAMVAGLLLGAATGTRALVFAPIGAVLGLKLPSVLLATRARRRREEFAVALPEVVDLLAVCTQAGLNIALSLRRVSDRTSGLMGRELRRTMDEIDLGVPRSQALRGLADRVGSDDLGALVGVLLSAERFGTQISVALESFAREVRARRRRRAEEQARRAPVKILFPLVFLILPAFVLLTVVPLLLSTFATLGL